MVSTFIAFLILKILARQKGRCVFCSMEHAAFDFCEKVSFALRQKLTRIIKQGERFIEFLMVFSSSTYG